MITTRQKFTRYGSSLAVVLAVHAVAIAIALHWTSAPPAIELPPAAMMVEMPPMPEAPPAPPPKVVQPPPPAPVEEPPLPKVAEAPKPTIALPKPVPKPKPKPQPPKPERKPEPPKEQVAKQAEDTPPAAPAPAPAPKQTEQPPMPSTPDAKPSWLSEIQVKLAKYKRYPDEARRRGQVGTATLKFEVDAEGNVLSAEIVSSSGSAALDRATLEMVRKASPLPKPPAEMLVNGRREITAPYIYSLDKRR
ncbi:energy transducer TonB [Pseudomonas sp. HR96]|uniref:energy transducer TonB family protein n=1 Tax=Pseudomonas sp. HR96 TaxID=1027966 RepID=UPI002A764416|nr:energy transducer TonB [Pseudomonas sp. HR96]WPO99847.1 energy transducer TonB [Pseudomonas sp. HR96]